MVTSLLLCVLVAIVYGWWAMARDNAVTIAELRRRLALAEVILTTDEQLRQQRARMIELRTELQRLRVEAGVLFDGTRTPHRIGRDH